MIHGEINFVLNGKRCRITFNNTTFPTCLTVWGEIDRGKRDWDGTVIMDLVCQIPSSFSKNRSDPIGEAFDHVHQNLESNTSEISRRH